MQSLGLLIEKTSGKKEDDEEKDKMRGKVERQTQYANVVAKRASILVRRQSMAEIARENQNQNQNQNQIQNESQGQNQNAGESSEPKENEEKPMDLKGATQVLSLLQSHTQDTNAFVRAASLRTLSTLCEKGFIPLSLFVSLTESCVERLKDKAVLVRKNAIGVCVCDALLHVKVFDCADGEQSVRSQPAASHV